MADDQSPLTYLLVFLMLMVLLAVSVGAAFVDLGAWNLAVALLISAAKATLVMLFFMHLLHSRHLVPVVAVSGMLWLGFLFVLSFADYTTRPLPTERRTDASVREEQATWSPAVERGGTENLAGT